MNRLDDALNDLEIHGPVTFSSARAQYRKMVKAWHPDRFSQETLARRQESERKIKLINHAWDSVEAFFNGKAESFFYSPGSHSSQNESSGTRAQGSGRQRQRTQPSEEEKRRRKDERTRARQAREKEAEEQARRQAEALREEARKRDEAEALRLAKVRSVRRVGSFVIYGTSGMVVSIILVAFVLSGSSQPTSLILAIPFAMSALSWRKRGLEIIPGRKLYTRLALPVIVSLAFAITVSAPLVGMTAEAGAVTRTTFSVCWLVYLFLSLF